VDILLLNASVLELPTARRASAIVYDGACDLKLWRPPGPDRDLVHAYGDTLQGVLDRERARLGGPLPIGGTLRLHPGKLRCDFLLWVGSCPAHGEVEPAAAPDAAVIERVALEAVRFAEGRDVTRLAFGAVGAGRGALPIEERLAAVVRGLDAYREQCQLEGKALVIEEVVVCDRSVAAIGKARRLVSTKARHVEPPPPRPVTSASSSSGRAARTRSPGAQPGSAPRKARTRGLDPEALQQARGRTQPYDRAKQYLAGEWMIHPRFGAGQVRDVLADRMVTVLFEDGEERRLVHQRT
jgi:O-acetyl-ADP-ribose deacetylase (regulator of RNase III)